MATLNDKDFIINVGPSGTFNKSGSYQTLPEDVDQMFDHFNTNQVKKIALYFHGGLVNEENGLDAARRVGPYIAASGCAPVCFVWETGLKEIVAANLSKISQTKLFTKLLKLLLKKTTEKLGFDAPTGRGIAGTALSDAAIEAEMRKPNPFSDYNRTAHPNVSRSAVNIESLAGRDAFLQAELSKELQAMIESDPDFVQTIQNTKLTVDATGKSTGARGFINIGTFLVHVVKIAYRIISRFIQKRDHDLYPTIVEEILREFYIAELGAWVWTQMKDKASAMWDSNAGRTGLDQLAGRYFLDKLALYMQEQPGVTVNLVGHSAGAIVTCSLLRHATSLQNSIIFNHIVFMAPACRVDLFKKECADNPSRYKDLRIFTMTDKNESNDILVPYFYTHSLLYLIAGILEDEGDSYDAYILGLERHIGYKKPYDIPELQGVHDYLYTAGTDRLCFSDTAPGAPAGLQTTALKHGDFDDNVPTLQSMQFILTY